MDERAVVTVFCSNAGKILLFRRSEDATTYPGHWGGVAGHVETAPEESARQEIREETGLSMDQVSLRSTGEPFEVTDSDLGVRWTVHPFRFETTTRTIETNWETAATAWVHPPEIRDRETVPELWRSWDRVRPTVQTVTEDSVHGSATIACSALEVLRDEAALLDEADGTWQDIAAIATELRTARESMAVVRTRIDRAMSEASKKRSPAAVREAASQELERAHRADDAAAANAAGMIDGKSVLTLSRSGTVERALRDGSPAAILIARSLPGGEGTALAEELGSEGQHVTLVDDANVPNAVRQADVVLIGADTVLRHGDVINKVGSMAAALAARWVDVPVYVAAATDKISPATDWKPETSEEIHGAGEPDSNNVDAADTGAVSKISPHFERVPEELITAVITEDGQLDSNEIAALAKRHEALAEWMANR